MAELLTRNEALFAGGTLSENQKDMFYEAVTKACQREVWSQEQYG